MSEPTLTDAEKAALLDGVSTGEVEVQTFAGPRYAAVRAFEIPERSRIATNSFPRLQRLNRRFASRAGRLVEQLVNAEVSIRPGAVDTCSFGEYCDRNSEFSLIVDYSARPLQGAGLIYIGAGLVRQLVESFYGGMGSGQEDSPTEAFTPGEGSVAGLFCRDLLATLADVWQPLIDIEPEQLGRHPSTDIIDGLESSDAVVCSEFDIDIAGNSQRFFMVWPTAMLKPLLPVFEGQKRERDAAQDAHWEQSIRAGIRDTRVPIASLVGHRQSTLGAVAELGPGDIIDISDPQKCRVCVKDVAILEGLFGTRDGHYAIESKHWLAAAGSADSRPTSQAAKRTQEHGK